MRVANDSDIESVRMSGTTLDNFTAQFDEMTYQSRGAYGNYDGKPKYRKLMLEYSDRASVARARNFWPSFMTSGRLDGNKPFDFARGLTSSPLGPLGSVLGFFTGGLQDILTMAALGFAAYLIITKMRANRDDQNGHINIVNVPRANQV